MARNHMRVLVATGVLIAASLVGAPAVHGSPSTSRPAERLQAAEQSKMDGATADAAAYAKEFGVDLAEATSRLTAQGEYGKLVERLAEQYPDTFAGSDIDHGAKFGLTLHFKGDKAAAAVKAAIGSAGLSRPSVRLNTTARLNAAEARALVEKIEVPAELAGHVDGIGYNVSDGTLTLDVGPGVQQPARMTAVNDAVRASAASLGIGAPAVAIRSNAAGASDGHSGGLHLSTCTSGFAVSVGGTQGLLTAGHCGNTQSYQNYCCTTWWPIYFQAEARTSTADVQWHTTNIGVYPRFVADNTAAYRTLTSRTLRSSQNGDWVCHRGKTTGYSCGTVSTITYRPTYDNACPGTTCSATWVQMSGASLRCYPGDSGGVVFLNFSAYGIYKGQSSSGSGAGQCSWMIYMAIDYISSIGATLLFG